MLPKAWRETMMPDKESSMTISDDDEQLIRIFRLSLSGWSASRWRAMPSTTC